MEIPIKIVVESLPDTDNFTFLNFMTIATPFVLVWITDRINAKATQRAEESAAKAEERAGKFAQDTEKRANEYSDALRYSDDKKFFVDNIHRVIEDLRKKIFLLLHKKRRMIDIEKMSTELNDIVSSQNSSIEMKLNHQNTMLTNMNKVK